jgi:Plasmid pRiA4b ORF-3-like protein
MSITRLKITLDDVEPAVLRRIEVPLAIRLSDLHLVIQAAMPWENYHLYEFRVRDMRWGLPDPDDDWPDMPKVHPAQASTLADLIETTGAKSFKYLYDFGDGWEHTLKIEKPAVLDTGAAYPRLIEAKAACPPEDVGGPWGYQSYLEAIADPKHPEHKNMIAWRGRGFDPNTADVAGIEKGVAQLARKFAPKPVKPRKKAMEP